MSTLIASSNAQRLHVKGASEIVLQRCDMYLDAEGNRVDMTSEVVNYFDEMIDSMANKGKVDVELTSRGC